MSVLSGSTGRLVAATVAIFFVQQASAYMHVHKSRREKRRLEVKEVVFHAVVLFIFTETDALCAPGVALVQLAGAPPGLASIEPRCENAQRRGGE